MAAGDRKRDITDATTLLDRVIPERYLLLFDKASHLDPMLDQERSGSSKTGRPTNLINYLKNQLETK